MENGLTLVGNLTTDPELRFTSNGTAVVNFTIAHTPRVRENGEWVDGPPLFMKCTVWRQYGENVAESLRKGMQVLATGQLRQREFQAQDGTTRTVTEMDVDAIGPTLKFATAVVTKASRDKSGQWQGRPATPTSDPLAGSATAPNDEPPF